jgi:hypothetical protein
MTAGICLVTCGYADTGAWGRVTTHPQAPARAGAGVRVSQSLGRVKSKNRAGSASWSAVRMVFWPVVVAERCAT